MMDYIPARLVKGHVWYIIFYAWDPATRKLERIRRTYNLNRIRSARDRMARARELVVEINRLLPYGYPYNQVSEIQKWQNLPMDQAMKLALQVKLVNMRPASARTYRSMADRFMAHLRGRKEETLPVGHFERPHALRFLDQMDQKGITGRTHNNYIMILKALFGALLDRQLIQTNPWVGIKHAKVQDKGRRPLTVEEARVILAAAKQEDTTLYLVLLLQYYCFLRPNELRRIRIRHLDLDSGLIRVPGSISKNKRDGIITIPDSITEELRSILGPLGKDWYLVGTGGRPGPTGPAGQNTMARKHLDLIRGLHSEGRLGNIDGVSLYSWKDTGARDLVRAGIPIDEVMMQLRHSDLATTQVYIQSLHKVNERIRDLKCNLI